MVPGRMEYRPGESTFLKLQTDSLAHVALGAIDTALYAVGSKTHTPLDMNKVCQDSTFAHVPSLSPGCPP